MKLIDAIAHKGTPFWIPDCSRDDLPGFFRQLGFTTGAEIGVGYATNLKKYCQAGLTMYGIDPWQDYEAFRLVKDLHPERFDNTNIHSMDDIYKSATIELADYPNCKLIRKTSVEAAKDFDKRSLDFVYIDGNHGFAEVATDLAVWSQKVKRGGIIAGDDYHSMKGNRKTRMVKYVVDAFAQSFDFQSYYVLGRTNPKPGERNDGVLNFMFIKHW